MPHRHIFFASVLTFSTLACSSSSSSSGALVAGGSGGTFAQGGDSSAGGSAPGGPGGISGLGGAGGIDCGYRGVGNSGGAGGTCPCTEPGHGDVVGTILGLNEQLSQVASMAGSLCAQIVTASGEAPNWFGPLNDIRSGSACNQAANILDAAKAASTSWTPTAPPGGLSCYWPFSALTDCNTKCMGDVCPGNSFAFACQPMGKPVVPNGDNCPVPFRSVCTESSTDDICGQACEAVAILAGTCNTAAFTLDVEGAPNEAVIQAAKEVFGPLCAFVYGGSFCQDPTEIEAYVQEHGCKLGLINYSPCDQAFRICVTMGGPAE